MVVDATGVGALLEPVADPGPVAAQVAFGVELACEHGFAPDEMLFMDFSPLAEDDAGPWPTFLYAMPFGPGRVFVEETVLVARPAPKIETLEARLGQRLERRGLADAPRVGAVERCFIPMGGPLPRGPQPVVPFGAAAGMVHPATGYQLTRALGLARPLAQSLARGLRGAPDRPAVAAELGWETVWPASRRRIWEVYRFGMELLLSFDSEDTRTFFRSFFDLDPNTWARYLDGAGEGRDVAAAMAGVFARLPWRVRTQIMAHSLGRPGFALLHAMSNL